MPTIRYQISNEFKLGNPLLYRASSKDEPEALLEGVATAGLVGLLKQLGDLAEFASEIFHDLHKEMMATARRGHGLKLRIQQIEAECPSIEKSFLCHSNRTHFLYATGISWHAKLRMDENLIVRERMPQFVADSYEECRGPPDFSALDKFDATGDGACLRRYSDPSFFKLKLVKREKNVQDNKKTRPCWRHGENPGIVSAPRIDCRLQFMRSKIASEELPVTRVKLKSRVLYESDTARHVEDLYRVLFPEESTASKSSKKSISDVQEISSDASSHRETNPRQSPITEEATEHEVSTEGSSDDNTSVDIASDVENYVDALNTMESEVETECEYNVKPNVDFTTTRQGIELNSLETLDSRGKCTPEASPIKPVSTYGEEFSNCSITDSTSSLMHFSSNGVAKDSDVMLPCTSENSTVCSQTKNSAKSSDASSDAVTFENIYREEYAEELDLKEMNVTFDRQGETLPSSFHESTEQLTEAFLGDIYLQKSCITMQTRGLPEEMEICSEPVDNLVYSGVELTLKNTNFEPLGDVKEPQESEKQDQNVLEITEKLVPTDIAGITDAKSSFDFCHTIPNKIQKDCMDRYNIDKDPGSETSPCHHQDSDIEVTVPIEESLDLQGGSIPNLISFEKYLSLQNGSNQSKPTDNMGKSDSMYEPDSQVTSSNVSFTEFLKLTQMDWLLNIEKKVNVDPLQNEEGHGSKSPVKRSHSPPDVDMHQSNPFSSEYGNFEQSLPGSIPATKNERPQHDQLTNPDNHTKDVKDDEKSRLVHRPRDPLIEEVASHDKSMLRKVSEPVQPSAKPKTNERDALLKEIRNKSHNLKPIGGVKSNMRAPAPILNMAILEKAISIRQACIGSDDDDDGDSWSDS